MVVLLVMWRQFHVPLRVAAERCFVAGLAVYTALALAAALLLAFAGVAAAPGAVTRYVLRLASVGAYAALRYLYGMTVLQSLAAWAALYVVSGLVVRRMERRAIARAGA
jgi:hypothetical protein